jgi:hypothetical protein
MRADIVIYNLLKDSSNIFPFVIPQATAITDGNVYVTYSVVETDSVTTKSSFNDYDRTTVQLSFFSSSLDAAMVKADAVRLLIDRYSAILTVATVEYDVDLISFVSQDFVGYDEDNEVYMIAADYQISLAPVYLVGQQMPCGSIFAAKTGVNLNVADKTLLWIEGAFYTSYKGDVFLVAGSFCVFAGNAANYAAVTSIDLNNQSLTTNFTTAIFNKFSNLVTILLNDNSLTTFAVTIPVLVTTINLSNNVLDYLVNSQLLLDLDANNQSNGSVTSTISGAGFLTPVAVDAANSLIVKNWSVSGLDLALDSGVTYNVADFPKIWIDNLLYNTVENKGNTFVSNSAYPMTGQVAYDAVTGIDLNNKVLTTDFNFLDKFLNLLVFRCFNNNITNILLTNKTLLKATDFRCYDNNLTNLNTQYLTKLVNLLCQNNSIPSLDLELSADLVNLFAQNNLINSISLLNNPFLLNLHLADNNLTELDLVNNTALDALYVYRNDLSALNTDYLINLRILEANDNAIASLNIVNNIKLINVRVQNNQLSNLINSQILIDLDTHGLSNGYFRSSIFGGGTLTAAGTTAKNALLAKGWTIVGL